MDALLYVLLVLIIIGLCLLVYALVEPRCLKVTNDTITIPNDTDNSSPLKILYFSDLHAEFCFISSTKVCELIESTYSNEGLDIVVFGGDICNNPGNFQKGANYLNKVAMTCQKLGIPFIGTNGNHDVSLSIKELSSCGFTVLSDDNFFFNKGEKIIRFSGVSDTGRHHRVWHEVPMTSKPYDLHILLSHNPDQILHITDDMPDVMLSGHIHGGQIRTPFGIEFTVLRKDELPKKGVISGINNVCGSQIFISKGIGCVLLPFRIGARPEVNIITIK